MTQEELKNYIPKGDLKGFPKEIISRMLDCQEKQFNKRDVSVFERGRTAGKTHKGICWIETKEGSNFWNRVIRFKEFDVFFEKYPKQGVCSECKKYRKQEYQESKTAKYVQVGDNAISSDSTSTQSSVEIEINTNEEDSQKFRVGDKVIDIIIGEIGFVKNIDLNNKFTPCQLEVNLNNNKAKSYTLEGKYFSNNKKPQLLHYRDDYNYDVIDFNNLPKRQEPKRWRANRGGGYWIINDLFEVYEFEEDNTDTDTELYNLGNYFQTEKEAQEVADKLNKYLQELINPNK